MKCRFCNESLIFLHTTSNKYIKSGDYYKCNKCKTLYQFSGNCLLRYKIFARHNNTKYVYIYGVRRGLTPGKIGLFKHNGDTSLPPNKYYTKVVEFDEGIITPDNAQKKLKTILVFS